MKILIILTSFVSGLIHYDTNLFKGFDYSVNTAFFAKLQQQLVKYFFLIPFLKFQKQFQPQYQLIHGLQTHNFFWKSQTYSQYVNRYIYINLDFNLKILCPSTKVFGVRIKWYAICGSSFQVINYISTTSIVNMTFPHTLSNAKSGFVQLTGLQYSGKVDFLLKISELTSSSISVQINKVDLKFQNLLKIGYQVVVTEHDIINLGLKTTLDIYTSQSISKQCQQWFIFNLQGLNYFSTDNIRLNLTYTDDSNSLSYYFGQWYGQPTGSYHSQLWLRYEYNFFSCIKIKTQRRQLSKINELPDKIINFIDLNQQYISIGQYEFILNQKLSYMQIKVSIKCFLGKIIQSSFHYKNDCDSSQMQVIKYQCQTNFNFITFHLGFIQLNQASCKLKIMITNQSIELFQVFNHHVEREQLLMKIEQLDL